MVRKKVTCLKYIMTLRYKICVTCIYICEIIITIYNLISVTCYSSHEETTRHFQGKEKFKSRPLWTQRKSTWTPHFVYSAFILTKTRFLFQFSIFLTSLSIQYCGLNFSPNWIKFKKITHTTVKQIWPEPHGAGGNGVELHTAMLSFIILSYFSYLTTVRGFLCPRYRFLFNFNLLEINNKSL